MLSEPAAWVNTTFRAALGYKLWFLAERLAAKELLSGPLWSLMCRWSESTHSHLMFSLSRYFLIPQRLRPHLSSHHSHPLVFLSKTFSPPSTLEYTSTAIQSPSLHSGGCSIGALCLKSISLTNVKHSKCLSVSSFLQ